MALLDGQRVVVTGSTRGIGRAMAVALARHGARVVVNGTNTELLDRVVDEIRSTGGEVAAAAGSVADYETCERIIGTCVDTFGGIDHLINNAGHVRDRTLLKMTPEEFDDVVAVHLRGSWACTKFAVAAMKDAGGGHIVNVISATALSGGVGQCNYGAAKGGMLGMTRALVPEVTRYGVRINCLWPIAMTDMSQVVLDMATARADEAGKPAPKPHELGFGTPEEVAPIGVFLCSPAAAHLNAQVITFNGRKLALWTHPREINIEMRSEPWSVDDLVRDFAATAGRELQELWRPPLI